MDFTKFDKTPFLSKAREFGDLDTVPGVLDGVGRTIKSRMAALCDFIETSPEWWTVYEVDAACIEFLRLHPFFVYGEAFFTAVAPPHDPLSRRAYIRRALESGLSSDKVAGQLGVPVYSVTRMVNNDTPDRKVHHSSKYTEDQVRALKVDLAAGMTARRAALKHAIPYGTVTNIASGRQWSWVDVASAA
jgi:hypothetical protein